MQTHLSGASEVRVKAAGPLCGAQGAVVQTRHQASLELCSLSCLQAGKIPVLLSSSKSSPVVLLGVNCSFQIQTAASTAVTSHSAKPLRKC